jgi:hypothetical protein
MTTENAFVFEATPFDINYVFKVETHMTAVKARPQSLSLDFIGKDVNGREDMEIKGHLQYDRTDSPLISTINSTLKYPGLELFYWSTVKQIKDLTFVGTSKYQLQKGRIVTVVHNERFVLKNFSNSPEMITSNLRAFFISKNILSIHEFIENALNS